MTDEPSSRKKTRPLFHWYVDSALGKELVFALYTRPCRYGRCAFCALPGMSLGGEVVAARDIERQVDFVLSEYEPGQLHAIRKVSVYTASSSLDQECLPTRSLMYLALKIAEVERLRQTLGEWPILLLDDVSSELDAERNELLFRYLNGFSGQVLITTTSPGQLRLAPEIPRSSFVVRDGAPRPS